MGKHNRSRSRRPARRVTPYSNNRRESVVDATPQWSTSSRNTAFTDTNPNRLQDAWEWTRGKTELLWENRLLPLLGWLGAIPDRFAGAWGRQMRFTRRARRSGLSAIARNERSARALRQFVRFVVISVICLGVVGLFATGAFKVANALAEKPPTLGTKATPLPKASPTPNGAITIRNIDGSSGTIPPAPTYTLGMWASNNTPSVGGSTIIYAKVVQNGGTPVAGVVVSFSVYGHALTATTTAEGLAQVTVGVGSGANNPVLVDGSATVNGVNLTAQTWFSPL